MFSLTAVFGAYIFFLTTQLPAVEQLKTYQPPLISFVFDREGEKIGEFFRERRILVPYEEFPKVLISAFVSAEDGDFFKHKGLNIRSIFRAFLANIRAGRKVQGGSTITQQTARALLLSSEKTYTRKLKEAILALRMERNLSKEHILYLYLNQIYLGHGAYGVGMAAEIYFRKKVQDLNLSESALLAGLPQAPSRFSPIYNLQKAKERQLYVLQRMKEENYISEELEKKTAQKTLKVYLRQEYQKKAPYYQETLRQILSQELGEENLLTKGLRIKASVDIRLQSMARKHLRAGLRELDKRQGFRGPLQRLESEEQIQTFFEEEEKKQFQNSQAFRLIKPVKDIKQDPETNLSVIEKDSKLSQIKEDLKGLVRVVDDQSKQVLVQLAFGQFGILLLEDMKWARKPNPKVYYKYSHITQPSSALKPGDLILVRILKSADRLNQDEWEMEKKAKDFFIQQKLSLPSRLLPLSLEQEPAVEGALIVFHQKTGDILAMVGGYDFNRSQFNRTYQASRQTGSVFKPIVYTAALDKGFNPSTIITDSPVVFNKEEAELKKEQTDESQEKTEEESSFVKWKPDNYGRRFSGDILFRNALIRSMNVPTVKIIESVGIKQVQNYARRLGIFSGLNPDYTLALGSSSITLYEMTKAFAVIGRLGKKINPWLVREVADSQQEKVLNSVSLDTRFVNELEPLEILMEERRQKFLLEQEKTLKKSHAKTLDKTRSSHSFFFIDPQQLISEQTAYIMHSLLRAVIKEPQGTGYSAHDMEMPIAGKTGTTNGYYDAWFIGYNSQMVAGVWVGFDNEYSLGRGETGGRATLPIWKNFMEEASQLYPPEEFTVPQGVIFINIDNETGGLVNINSKQIVEQAFVEGTQPVLQDTQEVQDTEDQSFLREDIIQ